MDKERLLRASYHTEKARSHSVAARRYRGLAQHEVNNGLSRTERFDAVHSELLAYLTEGPTPGHLSTPEVVVRGEIGGENTEAWLKFSITGEGVTMAISYSARTKNGGSDSRCIGECRCIRESVLEQDFLEASGEDVGPWPPLIEIEETFEVYRTAFKQTRARIGIRALNSVES